MIDDNIKCSKCNALIPKENILFLAITDAIDPNYETITCNKCIGKEYGETFCDYLRSLR